MSFDRDSFAFRALLLATLIWMAIGFAFLGQEEQPTRQQGRTSPGPNPKEVVTTKSLWTRTVEDAPSFWTSVLAGLTVVLAGVGVGQIYFLRRADETTRTAADAAKRSADVARDALIASNRAWITGEMAIGDQSLSFINGGLNFMVGFNLRNIGNAPALKVSFRAWLIGRRLNRQPTVEDRHRQLCAEARQEPPIFEFCLFPQQTFPQSAGYTNMMVQAVLSPDEYEQCIHPGQYAGGAMFIFVGGCVNYTFATDPDKIHQTSFLYEINRTTIPNLILVAMGDIPGRELRLSGLTFGDGRNAD